MEKKEGSNEFERSSCERFAAINESRFENQTSMHDANTTVQQWLKIGKSFIIVFKVHSSHKYFWGLDMILN